MRSTPAIAVATVLAASAGVLIGTSSGSFAAAAAGDFRVTPEQLQINQRISQAAVRRSNEALGLLGPVRPVGSTDQKPINPFPAAQRGKGWPTNAYGDGSITQAKLDEPLAAATGAVKPLKLTRLTNGQTAPLLTAGTLTFTAVCRINQGGQDVAEVLISTTANGAVFDGEPDNGANLTPATPEGQRRYARVSIPTGQATFNQTREGAALDPAGVGVTGSPFLGVNLPGRPAGECSVGGTFLVS